MASYLHTFDAQLASYIVDDGIILRQGNLSELAYVLSVRFVLCSAYIHTLSLYETSLQQFRQLLCTDLTHSGRDKMDAISQTTYSSAFS